MNKRRKVLIYEPVHREGTRLLEEKCEVVYPESLEEAHLITLAGDIDGIFIRANGTVSRRLIESAPRLKVIGRHGVGVETIDLTAARENGMLKLMKPMAFLINMARGPVWNEADVVRALRENWIAGVGSDVFEVEPAVVDNPLFEMDNFVGTPHMAAHTGEALIRMSLVARDILRIIEGQEQVFPIPEEIYAQYQNV